jgi:hypothetical protein
MRKSIWFLVIVGFLVAVQSSRSESTPPPPRLLKVSAPNLQFRLPERVVRFDFEVTGAILARVKTPNGWQMKIENNTSNVANANAKLEANIVDGAAAFTPTDASYFRDFVELGNIGSQELAPTKLNMRLTVWIATNTDMTKFQKLVFSKKQLKISDSAASS